MKTIALLFALAASLQAHAQTQDLQYTISNAAVYQSEEMNGKYHLYIPAKYGIDSPQINNQQTIIGGLFSSFCIDLSSLNQAYKLHKTQILITNKKDVSFAGYNKDLRFSSTNNNIDFKGSFSPDYQYIKGSNTKDNSPLTFKKISHPHADAFMDFIALHLRTQTEDIFSLDYNFALHKQLGRYTFQGISTRNANIQEFSENEFSYTFQWHQLNKEIYGNCNIYALDAASPSVLLIYQRDKTEAISTAEYEYDVDYHKDYIEIWQLENNVWTNKTTQLLPENTLTTFESEPNGSHWSFSFDTEFQSLSIIYNHTTADKNIKENTFLLWDSQKFTKQ